MTNFTLELHRLASDKPDAPALLFRNITYSYAQVDGAVWCMAERLYGAGLRPGMLVGHTFGHELSYAICMLAVCRLGATVVSLPAQDPQAYRTEVAGRSGVRLVLSDQPDRQLTGIETIHINPESAVGKPTGVFKSVLAPPHPLAPCQLVVGSGSTGRKKLLPITHAQLLARMAIAWDMLEMTAQDRAACLTSLDYVMCSHRLFEALCIGASFVLLDQSDSGKIATCRDNRVSMLNASVFHIESLLRQIPPGTSDYLGFLRVLRIGAATVTEHLRSRVTRQLSSRLYVRYASNEFGPVTIALPSDITRSPGTVGRPDPRVQIKLTGPDGRVVEPGDTGQIWLKGPGMIEGYLDDPIATTAVFKDGWFTPNDLGRFTPDGQLIYCGRADHMMIFNGINVYPAEIENVMSSFPGVRDVACVPLKSGISQDVPLCVLTFADQHGASKADLMRFAHENLGPQRPREFVVLPNIPRTESGKLLREDLMRAVVIALKTSHPATAARDTATSPPEKLPLGQQIKYRFAITFACPAAIETRNIDVWLTSAMAVRPDPHDPSVSLSDSLPHASATNLLTLAIPLAQSLLQASGIPVFDQGQLLDVRPLAQAPSTWSATLLLSKIDLIPVKCYGLVMKEAIEIVQWMARTPINDESRNVLYAGIQKRVIQPLRPMVGGGKSTMPILRAAYQLNIPFNHLGAGVYQLGWGSKARRMDRSTTGADSAIGSKLTGNKVWTASLLRMSGLPAPVHALARTPEEALDVARKIGWPLVVKPVDGERGEGVTVGVRDDEQLLKAFALASKATKANSALVEREVNGVCHRLFIAHRRLLYAVKRWPKSVHGDGRQTIEALIHEANRGEASRPPWLRSETFPMDALAQESILQAGFSLDDIPPAGRRVPLRNIESTRWGGFDEDVTTLIHPDNLDIALRAAALFGLEVAGIDIITTDIGTPWHESGAILNEVNFAPLLGGGEISRRNIPAFLHDLLKGSGRIPVEAVMGGQDALSVAQNRQTELASRGIHCHVTSHRVTLKPSGIEMNLTSNGLYERCRALLTNAQVDALVLVVQTDELLDTGMPVDCIDQLTVTEGMPSVWKRTSEELAADRYQALGTLLRRCCRQAATDDKS